MSPDKHEVDDQAIQDEVLDEIFAEENAGTAQETITDADKERKRKYYETISNHLDDAENRLRSAHPNKDSANAALINANNLLQSSHAIPIPGFEADYASLVGRYENLKAQTETKKVADRLDKEPVVTGGEVYGPRTLEESLNEAREKYVKAEREFEKTSGIKSWIPGMGKHRKKVEEELDKVEAEYKKTKTEFVLASVEKHIAEKRNLTEARLAEFAKRGKNPLETAAAWNRKLGEINVVDKLGYKGPFKRVAKFFNARTAISGGLMAAGFINARGVFSAVTAGLGTYGLVSSAREAYLAKNFKGDESLSKTEELIASLESRALLDGKNQELLNNPTYKKMIARQEQLLRETSDVHLIADDAAEYLRRQSEKSDELLGNKMDLEKKWKRIAVLAGTGAGVLVGLGVPGKLIGQIKTSLWGPTSAPGVSTGAGRDINLESNNPHAGESGTGIRPGAAPEVRGLNTPAPPEHLVPSDSNAPAHVDALEHQEAAEAVKDAVQTKVFRAGASIDIKGAEGFVRAGGRGIEGALIDLKDANSDKYAELIKHLRAAYGEKMSENNMIHKFVSDYADKNGYNIGGEEGSDLNWIKSAEVKIGSGGVEITHQDFMEHAPVPSSGSGIVEPNPPQYQEHVLQDGEVQIEHTDLPADSNQTDILHQNFEPIPAPPRVPFEADAHEAAADYPDTAAEYVSTESAAEAMTSSPEAAALAKENLSDGLKLVLKDRYDKFLHKFLKVSAGRLNELKNMSVEEFRERWDEAGSGSKFQKQYKGIAKFYTSVLSGNSSIDKAGSMKEAIIKYAARGEWK